MSEKNNTPLIEVKNLKQHFPINVGAFKTKPLKAVDGVSFSINRGETLGLVGESGCGKTTVGRTLLHLYKPTDGEIYYDGKLIQSKEDIKEFRKKATMVFQDPYSSLNPRMTVADIIGEPLDVHKLYKTKEERQARILELMSYVGMHTNSPAVSVSVSALHVHWQLTPTSSFVTNLFPLWTYPSRHRLSICSRNSRKSWV